jgi:hypothetical protein
MTIQQLHRRSEAILDILDHASNVVAEGDDYDATDYLDFDIIYSKYYSDFRALEPTPIGPNGLQYVVGNVPVPGILRFTMSDSLLGSESIDPESTRIILHNKESKAHTRTSASWEDPINVNNQYDRSSDDDVCPLQSLSSPKSTGESSKFDVAYGAFQIFHWNKLFQELLAFRAEHGHLFVPHNYPRSRELAQWVKR